MLQPLLRNKNCVALPYGLRQLHRQIGAKTFFALAEAKKERSESPRGQPK